MNAQRKREWTSGKMNIRVNINMKYFSLLQICLKDFAFSKQTIHGEFMNTQKA